MKRGYNNLEKNYNSFAILAVVFLLVFFPLGIAFGIISLVQIKKTGEKGKWLVIASIIIYFIMIWVVWLVVRSLFGGDGFYINENCITTGVEVTAVSCSNVGVNKICDVTIQRTGAYKEPITGVKLFFSNKTVVPPIPFSVITVSGNIEPSTSVTKTGINTTLSSADTVAVTVYLYDESGKQQICAPTNSFKFA